VVRAVKDRSLTTLNTSHFTDERGWKGGDGEEGVCGSVSPSPSPKSGDGVGKMGGVEIGRGGEQGMGGVSPSPRSEDGEGVRMGCGDISPSPSPPPYLRVGMGGTRRGWMKCDMKGRCREERGGSRRVGTCHPQPHRSTPAHLPIICTSEAFQSG
jgi:hypothetical protein